MRTPRISQLPLPILLIPNLQPVIRRTRNNSITVKIELCDRDQVAMARLEVGEIRAHPETDACCSSSACITSHQFLALIYKTGVT